MISIIISSANARQLRQVSKNIALTVGVPHEVIAIDNRSARQGICEVYNTGIARAQFDILCFMHEDIEIKSQNWGKTVLQIFTRHPEYGLLGVSGCAYKTVAPSGWNCSGVEAAFTNIIQHFKHGQNEPLNYYKNPGDKKLAEVTCVDGVWFCAPKKVADEVMFDAEIFKGFHVYDIDFSLAVGRKYKVAVTFDVLMEHFSEGSYNADWMEETIKLHKKWNTHLPINLLSLSAQQIIRAEKATFKYLIDQLIAFKFPIRKAFELLNLNNGLLKLDTGLYIKLQFYILQKYLRHYIR